MSQQDVEKKAIETENTNKVLEKEVRDRMEIPQVLSLIHI